MTCTFRPSRLFPPRLPFRSSRAALTAVALAALLAAPSAVRAEGTYTMEEAVRHALEANPRVESAEHAVEAAESARKAVRGAFGPSVNTSYGVTRYNEARPMRNDQNVYAWGVGATQPIFTGFNLLNTYQKATLQKESQELQLQNARLAIVGQVQAQFLNYLRAEENIRSTQRSLDRARAQLELAQAAFHVGLRPRLDILQAEVDVTRAEAVLIQSENTRSITRAQLNTLLNLPVNADVNYAGDLGIVKFERAFESLLEEAFRARPDLLLAQKAVDIARKDQGIARASFFPQLAASLNWGTQGDSWDASGGKIAPKGYSQWQAGLTAQWNLFSSGRRWYTSAQARSQVAALQAQMQSTFNNAAYEIQSSLLGLQDSRRMIAVAERAILRAQESYDNARMRYQLESGTNLDLLTAQSELAAAELALTAAKADYLTTLSRLYIAIGEIRPDLKAELSAPAN